MMQRWAFRLAVKTPVKLPASHVGVPGCDPWLCLLTPASWETAGDDSRDGVSTTRVRDLDWVPGSWLGPVLPITGTQGREPGHMNSVYLSLSASQTKQKNAHGNFPGAF